MNKASDAPDTDYSTRDVAALLGLAVRSVQLMVDRGELQAWKTPGGHRRIDRASVDAFLQGRESHGKKRSAGRTAADAAVAAGSAQSGGKAKVLIIEDSKHYQKLASMLLRNDFPELEIFVADDGFAGLAMAGQLRPALLIVDILLPGMDGATLIASLRSHAQFADSRLIVLTSLDETDLAPYMFALDDVPIVHKSRMVTDLPRRIRELLGQRDAVVA
ncbi:response regulator [Variovorax sp. N23]|uniref:response regulator n=1 Tax=Variovorax sp. N23 TaxID=2980555 RepID=UPI0021C9302E|nr:response regulator [Variovorax sp. N23]MCU4120257.1 response regulator [Variovorax sp. N23]